MKYIKLFENFEAPIPEEVLKALTPYLEVAQKSHNFDFVSDIMFDDRNDDYAFSIESKLSVNKSEMHIGEKDQWSLWYNEGKPMLIWENNGHDQPINSIEEFKTTTGA